MITYLLFPSNIPSSGTFRAGPSERENGGPPGFPGHLERFPSVIEDEFDEIEEVKEEYINAPLFQRIHISGEDTSGVGGGGGGGGGVNVEGLCC